MELHLYPFENLTLIFDSLLPEYNSNFNNTNNIIVPKWSFDINIQNILKNIEKLKLYDEFDIEEFFQNCFIIIPDILINSKINFSFRIYELDILKLFINEIINFMKIIKNIDYIFLNFNKFNLKNTDYGISIIKLNNYYLDILNYSNNYRQKYEICKTIKNIKHLYKFRKKFKECFICKNISKKKYYYIEKLNFKTENKYFYCAICMFLNIEISTNLKLKKKFYNKFIIYLSLYPKICKMENIKKHKNYINVLDNYNKNFEFIMNIVFEKYKSHINMNKIIEL